MSDTLPSAVAPSLREWARKALLWLDGEDVAGTEMETVDGRSLDLALEGYALFGVEPGNRAAFAQPTAAPTDWRPISEAPKDGTPVLFLNAKYGYASRVLRWNADQNRFVDRIGRGTGLLDDRAWSHWTAPPATQEEGR